MKNLYLKTVFTVVTWIAIFLALSLGAVTYSAILISIFAVACEFLVWLIKSDWRTPDFDVPIYSLVVAAIAFLFTMILIKIAAWLFERQERADAER